jgi:hypothetical protein
VFSPLVLLVSIYKRQVVNKVSTGIYSQLNLGLSQETEDLKDVCLRFFFVFNAIFINISAIS